MKRNNYILQILACCLTSILVFFFTTNVVAQPANDLCASATPLTVDATETCVPAVVDNNAATDSGELPAPSCASYSGGDAWYTVTVPASGIVSVETNNDGSGTVTDSGMSLYSGTCGALTEIECDDDDSADGLFSLVELTGLTPGDIIYVRVWEFGNDVAGTFSVCAYEPLPPAPPPANDECANPVAVPVNPDLACGMVVNGTIESATDSGLDTPPEDNAICGGTEDDDVWFSFVATNTEHQIDLTNITGSTTDLYHSVWEGTCGALTNIICSDPNTSSLTGLTPGNTYYVRIYSWTATTGQDSVFDVCIGTQPPPPSNDECATPDPYPGNVDFGSCADGSGTVNVDFTPYTDSGNPSPTCDFGGDAVGWWSFTAPVISTAGDPIDLAFDSGACAIGIEAYELDCTTPASDCLGNANGTLAGLIQGNDYVFLIYDDDPPEASCDFCLSIACTSPEIVVSTQCIVGDEDNFYVELNVTDIGVGNTAYTVDVGGPQADITAAGSVTYGPFPAGTPVDVLLTGVDDPACGFTATGLIKDCTCPDDLALTGLAGPYCTTDAAIPLTYTPAGPFPSSVTIEFLTAGTFDSEMGLGLYAGTFDDGSVIGLPPAGTGLLGNANEPDIEASAAGANDLTVTGEYDPAPVGAPIVLSNLAPGDYTIYLGDTFGDGWNGATLLVTDECGNVLATEAAIEDISADTQDELAWVNFTLPLAVPFVQVSGNGVVQTSDPDGVANNGDEIYEFDPSQVTATGCDPVMEQIILTTIICDVTCEDIIDIEIFPPAQAPTITRDDDVCNYTLTPACPNDVFTPDSPIAPANPGDDPPPFSVNVANEFGCAADFMIDPPACPPPTAFACPTSDFGFPTIFENVCDGGLPSVAVEGVDFNIIDPDGTLLGAVVWVIGFDPTMDPVVDVTIPVIHSGADPCAPDASVTYTAFIQCDADLDGVFDLAAGDLWVEIAYHTFAVFPPAQAPTITRDDEVCNYTLSPACPDDVLAPATIPTAAPGEDPAPIDIMVTTAIAGSTEGCSSTFSVDPEMCTDVPPSCSLMALACNACPDPTCETSTVIDLMTGMELNDSQGGGATPVFPDYDITTNMGTLTLPAGGDMIFAVSGVTGLMLPNNISEICLTMDINVISGEIPFLLEFRIENGVPGQQLQFNTMVDGLGMCSVGGNLADAVLAAGFTFVNGASYAVVAAIADFDGTPVAEDLVVEISNIMLTVCAPNPDISGCTDPGFDNYDPDAVCDDGSCSNEPTCPMCGACETPNEIPFAEIGGGAPDFSFAGADAFDDGNAMGIFAGGNNTFAGHGWFIDQSAIPADAMIGDYCIFGDFNVVADPADLPLTIEFRIENNGVGTFIEFNTVVTASGPVTIGGNLSTGNLVGAFDINGIAPALVIAIAVPGLSGNAPPTQDIIVEYSNVYITDGTCNPATIAASTISTTDPTRICIDGVGDPINVSIDVDGGGTGAWVITDAAGIILALPPGPPFDLDGAGAGQCLIWYVNFEDDAFMPMVGDDAAAAVNASACAFLSNPITVDRIEVAAASISSPQGDPITICTDDGVDEPIDVTIDDAGIGANGAWVITDAAGIILALPAGPPFVIDGAGVGQCLIWWVNFDDPNFAPAVGDDAAALVAASTCAALSNPITVNREEDCGTCEDAIAGNVNVEEPMCDITGMMVEIFDSNGTSVGTATVDATTGDYSLPGLFACGTYTVQVVTGTAPVCYEQLGGTEGPFEFEVDGDGTADGANFGTTPQIPTLSQWGLITLALLMMCFGSIRLVYNRKEEFSF